MGPSRVFSHEELVQRLIAMQTPNGIEASQDQMFKGAVFGRDSCLTARFTLDFLPKLAEIAVYSLARLQGREENPRNGERWGQIPHEYRDLSVPGTNEKIYHDLADHYGEISPGKLCTFWSIDATPLWVILVGELCTKYGIGFLEQEIEHVSRERLRLREYVRRSAEWILRKCDESSLGVIENVGGYQFQVLRDGRTSHIHANGMLPNSAKPIACLEAQGYVYDALCAAGRLFRHIDARFARRLLGQALGVQEAVLKYFWSPTLGTFAMGIDKNPADGSPRLIESMSSVPGELLDSGIFEALSIDERRWYVQGAVEALYTPEFVTDVGIRSLALRHDHLIGYWSYQGARACWPVITHLVSRGLRRYGFGALAGDLAVRMINGVHAGGTPRELWYVAPEGNVVYDPEGEWGEYDQKIPATNFGEKNQGWTIAALLEAQSLVQERLENSYFVPNELADVGPATVWDEQNLEAEFERRYKVTVDPEWGIQEERAFVQERDPQHKKR